MNIELNLSERQLEDVVESHLKSINDTDRSSLSLRGLELLTYGGKISVLRQKPTNQSIHHRFDLLTHEKHEDWHILNLFELKKEEVNEKALTQAIEYADEILVYIINRVKHQRIKIRIHLIAPFVSENLYSYEQFKTDHYSLNFQDVNFDSIYGLYFDDCGNVYRNIHEFFKAD